MSSATARAAYNAALAALIPLVPVYPTLAVRIDMATLPDLWLTTDFVPTSDDPISIGPNPCLREIGMCRVLVVAKAGAGDSAAIAQADAIVDYFRIWKDATSNTRTTGIIPPSPSDQSDGRWLITAVDIMFQRDHF